MTAWLRPRDTRTLTLAATFAIGGALAGCGGSSQSTGAPSHAAPPSNVVAATPMSTEPSATATTQSAPPSLSVTWSSFTSKRFAYSIEHPEAWVAIEATADWPDNGWPSPIGNSVDRFSPTADATQRVVVSSDVLGPGEFAAGRRAEIDQETVLACRISGVTTMTIDGAEAQREDEFCFGTDYLIDVFVEHEGRIYLIDWYSKTEITPADRALFDAMLARFTFTG